MLSTASEPLPHVGSYCEPRSSSPLFDLDSLLLAAAVEPDALIRHELLIYAADVHGVVLERTA